MRHNLSFSNYFLKIATEKASGRTRGYMWKINPAREAELKKFVDYALEREKASVVEALLNPDLFLSLQSGNMNWSHFSQVLPQDMIPKTDCASEPRNVKQYLESGTNLRKLSTRQIEAPENLSRISTPQRTTGTKEFGRSSLLSSLLGIPEVKDTTS